MKHSILFHKSSVPRWKYVITFLITGELYEVWGDGQCYKWKL
jgi:hypothetical protein